MKQLYILTLFVLILISCKSPSDKEHYVIQKSEKILSFQLNRDVKMPYYVFPFEEKGCQYLSFQNSIQSEILIYEMYSGKLIKQMRIETEGSNAVIGGFSGYFIQSMNQIFVPSLYVNTIWVMDTTAVIKQKIDYSKTKTGQLLTPFIPNDKSQMAFINDSINIPLGLNMMLKEKVVENSFVSAVIDTVNKNVVALPMKFPQLMTDKDLHTVASSGCDYSRCYDGKDFIYSFHYDEFLYKANSNHHKVDKIIGKSKYIDHVDLFRSNDSDFRKMLKAQCEHATYGNILYDKYRNVYYRFVYPSVNVDDFKGDYINLIRSGGKNFSIIILDKNLTIIGETLFPDYTYNSKLAFVLKDGLYISLNHIQNPNYSDDVLSFQRFELKEK